MLMSGIKKKLVAYKWRERMTHPGKDDPDRTFYVIRRHADSAGLFSFAATNLGSIKEGIDRGMIPVVDMQNWKNPMLEPEEVGKVNAWELYFEQPCGYGLQDIAGARNVMLSFIEPPGTHGHEKYPDYNMVCRPEELAMWRDAASRYLIIRPEIEEKVQAFCSSNLSGHKTLGVLCRGTDYIQKRPFNHPLQPKTDAVIRKCREVCDQYGCDQIYLQTEDETIWEAMQEAFPGKIISYQKRRIHVEQGQNINAAGNAMMPPYERNREYLIAICILASCDCLVAGAAGGTYGALLLTKGFEYEYVFRLGRYVTEEPKPGTWEYDNAIL